MPAEGPTDARRVAEIVVREIETLPERLRRPFMMQLAAMACILQMANRREQQIARMTKNVMTRK